ncbi:hypothetical protein BC940DRAFT_267937 [Gongronella butleri]|nr:hypothetical protein BC940DRAFT_267937 [Gongronella butleri]
MDDDRPAGLKFTRNYYGFQRDQGSVSDKPSFLPGFSSSRYGDNANSLLSRPSLDISADRPILPAARDTPSNKNSLLSPTLPSRSPQRVRDSQTSTAYTGEHGSRFSSTMTTPTPSKKEELAPPPVRPRQSEARFSLSKQVDHLWHGHATSGDADDAVIALPKDLLHQLAVSQAVIEANDYKALSPEEADAVKKEYDEVKQQVATATSQLMLEMKMQHTSVSLAYLVDTRHNHSILKQQQQIRALGQQVSSLVDAYQQLKDRELALAHKLHQHTAALLVQGIQQADKQRIVAPFTANDKQQPSQQQQQQTQHLAHDSHDANTEELLAQKDKEIDQLRKQQKEQQNSMEHLVHQLTSLHQRFAAVDGLQSRDTLHDDENDDPTDPLSLVSRLDKTLNSQKLKTHQLEREIESIHEKQRLEALAEKKIEIQLRAAQERKEAAEARAADLQKELDALKNNHNSLSDLDRLKADLDSLNFNESSAHLGQINELESQLAQTEEHRQRLEKELLEVREQVTELQMEASKSNAELASAKSREKGQHVELQQYRDELFALENEKKKWERMMKRQTVMQLMDDHAGGVSIKDKYEQQLEEQAQEYMAQLKEQQVFLDKVGKDKEAIQVERDQLQATCHDLEELIRGKTRLLDSRDIHISELEAQVHELRRQSNRNASKFAGPTIDVSVLQELQEAFTRKEIAWMEQSASMETNFEGILKEFDRLTGTAVEFENERMNYERRIEELTQRMNVLDEELNQARINGLGYEDGNTPTTASLRKEFRRMVNDMKLEHQRLLDKEISETARVEKQLKDLKHEIAMANYEKVNKGIQTLSDKEYMI